jgi:hypothetical protein
VSENSKYASEYPENVTVVSFLNLMQLVKAYQMLEKLVYVLRALALRLGLDEFYFDNYAKTEIQFYALFTLLLPLNLQMLFVLLLMVIST